MVRKAKAVWRGTGRAGKGLGTVVCIAALSCRWFHHGWRIQCATK
jgi:hypothetical protein